MNVSLPAAPDRFASLAEEYRKNTRPLVEQFCIGCHSTAARVGELDLQRFTSLAEVRHRTKAWLKVVEMLDKGEMPPKGSKQPTPEQRKQLRDWTGRYLHAEALANAGDPGPVVLRRLNNAEYTYTIRDLTSVDLSPAREFPADGAAGEGFTNTGNALVMSPALLTKYLDAGKEIARHAVLLPDGFRFSANTTRRDWTDEILGQIRQVYRKYTDSSDLGVGDVVGNVNVHRDTRLGRAGRLPVEKYLAATLAERAALTSGRKTIGGVARERGLNARYLGTLWSALSGTRPSLLLDPLRSRWRAAGPTGGAALAAEVTAWQKGLWIFGPVGLIGRQGGPKRWMEPVTPVVTQQDIRFPLPSAQDGKEVVISVVVTDAGDGSAHDVVILQSPKLVAKGRPDVVLRDVAQSAGLDPALFGRTPAGPAMDTTSLLVRAPSVIIVRLPKDLAAGRELVMTAMLAGDAGPEGSAQVDVVAGTPARTTGLLPSEAVVNYSRVTQVFSDKRDLSFTRPILVGGNMAARRRFESAMEEYRNLFPAALCYSQIVPVDEVLTLGMFYREDDHLARLMLDAAEKAKLDRLWEELHFVGQTPLQRVTSLELLLEAFEGNGVADRSQHQAVAPLREPFKQEADAFRRRMIETEPSQVEALVRFASRAYRRPLTADESSELRALYRRLREQELPHEEAFRRTLARVFVASPFLYRLEQARSGAASSPISDWELASRLSYFLWSSQPDEELTKAAANGTLHTPVVLAKQTRRMLADSRLRRLSTEFACQWIHIQDFDSLGEKSEKHFPEFAELRGDMHEEAIRFFTDLFQRDTSLMSLLDADHTFVNERLARFYGIPGVQGVDWRRVDGLRQHGRGGILGLAATLAKQSGASRTSPILRGNWVSEVLLGEKLPRPPKEVPQLPSDETATDGLTVRQLVARHTSNPRCSGCHQRIDPFGFSLEGFDAIGRRRDRDMAGRPIDAATTLPDGRQIEGLAGLRDYLMGARREAFLRQFCRKLVGYALGREVQLSDEPLLTEIRRRLAANGYRFSVAVDAIVQSSQFRQIRGRDTQTAESP